MIFRLCGVHIFLLLLCGVVLGEDITCYSNIVAAGTEFKKGDSQLLVMEFFRAEEEAYLLSSMCLTVDTYSYMSMKQSLAVPFFENRSGETPVFNEDVEVRIHLYTNTTITESPTVTVETINDLDLEGNVVERKGLVIRPEAPFKTPYRHIAKGTAIVPYRTVLINLEKGIPMGIEWDERLGCESMCSANNYALCLEYSCMTEVDFSEEQDYNIVFSTFVAWKGDDKKGKKMLSKNSVDYEFRFVSGKSLYDSAVGIFNTVKDWFNQVIDDIKDVFP